jgi:GTP-binding protein
MGSEMNSRAPIVAIVGRANVGKSSLFNAIIGYREAIVAMEPGTTRDNVTAKASFKQHDFWLVDTAGMKDAADDFEMGIQEQIIQATDSADVILVVVEAGIMITDEDRRVARLTLKSKKPLVLVVNKADKTPNFDATDYMRLGIRPIVATSMTQRFGVDDLLTEVVKELPVSTIHQDKNRVRLAILGRPNVGKSNLFNTLAQKQQALVSSKAGTTRDINRTIIKFEGQEIELLDTAGIRRNGKIEVGIEKFSVLRSLSAIEQADVCLLLIDANEISVQLDQKIAGLIKEAGKGLILVVSKWDIVDDKTPYTRDNLAGRIRMDYEFIPWAPLIFTSAVTGQNVTKIFSLVTEIVNNRKQQISTPILNRWLRACADSHPPAGLKNSNPKLNYITQTDDIQPTFKVFGSHTKLLHWSYKRYLDKQLRQSFGFEGTPVKFYFLEKHVDRKKSYNEK